MKIILIRHAETDLAGTFCGHSNPPLNQSGKDQLRSLTKALQPYNITAVHTSDLERARATAQAIGDRFVTKVSTNVNLREIHFGEWEALTWSQIESRDSTYARKWIDSYPDLPAPRGELYDAFKTRVLQVIDKLMADQAEGTTAVVTHAGVLRLILTTYGGLTSKQAWQQTKPYCCIFQLSRLV